MVDLDNPQTYRSIDPGGMLGHLHALPEQCQSAWHKALWFDLPADYSRVKKAVVLGMGGSAIGGDLLRTLALLEGRVPVSVHRDYGLPPSIDEDTLLIASSYSGNTEETLSGFSQALTLPVKAKKLVLTSGGQLRALAEAAGIPVFSIDYKAPPRAAFPHSFIPLVGLFHKFGLLQDQSSSFTEALRVLQELSGELSETVAQAVNPAKRLAIGLSGKMAVIYGAGLLSEVAQRWKTQFNENSKSWAFYEVFPEINHNSIVGYRFPSDLRNRIMVLLLHSSSLHPRISQRYHLTAEILANEGVDRELIEARGDSPLAQMLGMVLLGDYVSFYLAMLNGVDPSPVAPIDYLKKRLAEDQAVHLDR
ncbi:MAG: bifunctional phosphoglucose/phosphomannose isomerase [Chloroflexi bacterium]|mgnify:FL=1|nr:MAG: bifunctional phosphoglucose/phosphomannose isomerase [Chloroflexota bacterium]RLC97223.1 MAG: bifunctional phosphoglucose/phosphomannose isomerase [Chloroflexota bacterium]